jgi:uncharacterized membrane protein YkvA (DUF1232 family)
MKISFELGDRDLLYFRERLKVVRSGEHATDEGVVLSSAKQLVAQILAEETPEFVRDRITKLSLLVRMLEDTEWRLEGADRLRVLEVLAYFVDPDDLIPDRIPGLGYLDDAIMVELVAQELRHEIEAYRDFCTFRANRPRDVVAEQLEARRQALQNRMRRRRRRERSLRASRAGPRRRSPISLW